MKHTLVNNWWQIRKTAIVAEISSTAIYCILSICMTLSMSWTRTIWWYTAVQRYLLRIGNAASRQTFYSIWISYTRFPALKQRFRKNRQYHKIHSNRVQGSTIQNGWLHVKRTSLSNQQLLSSSRNSLLLWNMDLAGSG